MKSTMSSIRKFLADESGPTSVEYCFMMGFILLVAIAAIGEAGEATRDLYKKTETELTR